VNSFFGIAADSPWLWNQWREPLTDVVCTPVRFVPKGHGEWETILGGRTFEGLKDMDE
jgi:hypothetical protein